MLNQVAFALFVQTLVPYSLCLTISPADAAAEEFRSIALQQTVEGVQPMTGIVLWTTNEDVSIAPIQLEYTYMTYAQIVNEQTEFPDWSHPELRRFTLDFFTRFAAKYDDDPRLAFVQVGFGLWAEYHIYDGPMLLRKTFPSKEFQAEFAQHLASTFQKTLWMISVDAGDEERSAFPENDTLLAINFGVFDDSFNHAKHKKENEPNWNILGRDRWKSSPAGGGFPCVVYDRRRSNAIPETRPDSNCGDGLWLSLSGGEVFSICNAVSCCDSQYWNRSDLL